MTDAAPPIAETAPQPQPKKGGPLRFWFAIPLWQRILVALILGGVIGYFWGEGANSIKWIGDVFIRLIRMIVAPLVFFIIASGVAQLGDARRLGSIGFKTIGMYLLTTIIAVSIGLTIATIIAPGLGATFQGVTPGVVTPPKSTAEMFISIVPTNPIKSLAEGETLSIIFFALIIGVAVILAGKSGEPVARGLQSGSEVMLKVVEMVMEVAPFGVFALICVLMGNGGAEIFTNIAKLAACVLIGSLIQTFITHGAVIRFGAWLPLIPFYRGVADAIMVGFSTSSSSATLPVAIRVAEENLGIKPTISSTVLPLGATIGMDGTAMYIGMLTLFACQAFGVELSIVQYVLVALTIAIVAMGAAPVPSGSFFVLPAVLASIGIVDAQTALIVGFILPFDRILDMMRTVPNVTCDLAIATAVARWEGEIDVDEYKSAKDV
ncbi:cation:dicarboxylase symporter family transporter [Caulobacter sp. SLTY]|uniref:dicarboxylate/amino acid:cation symporter n=1 Tax=Caulobacter sp. SLTY TaxID=2683262 RepID=UPI0014130E38|nr:dicarboxylate/amino acid:cation symporter [Caulobacter sp. SLTY]NBB14543.1 cation:dicarboxylase symporter family transporter [Caulobacter sp. SLTY]